MIVSKEVAKIKIEDYDKYYINGSDHYLMPKGELIELFDEMVNWREESKQLKEVIDKAIEYINNLRIWYEHNDNICSTEDKFKNDLLEILKEEEND